MSSLSIIDKAQNHSHLHHFVVQTRTFQIEKARDVDMYGNLRVYIKRQNEKRKQEMAESEELKRARREKELKHKRDKLTLGEIKEEIGKNETKLNQLQNEKHNLFTEFKKVLNEDENRKNIERAKEAAAFNNMQTNMTFGPPTTTPSQTERSNHNANKPYHQQQPQQHQQQQHQQQQPHISISQGTIMPNSSHANMTSIMPSSLHHLQPIQPMFFSQPSHAPTSSTASNVSSSHQSGGGPHHHQAAMQLQNHHRLSGRVPTPTTFAGSQHSSKSNQPAGVMPSYSKPQMPPHLSGHMSASQASSMMPSASVHSSYNSDRHRISSYKRSHEQASPSQVNQMQSQVGVINVPGSVSNVPPSSHLHYMPNYPKPQMQPQMSLPPGAYAQLGGQHVLPNLEQLQNLQNLPLYQSLFSSYGNPMYMNNPNSK